MPFEWHGTRVQPKDQGRYERGGLSKRNNVVMVADTFAVQGRIDHVDGRRRAPAEIWICGGPVSAKIGEACKLALGAGPVPGGKRGSLVEKKSEVYWPGGIGGRLRPLKSSMQTIQRRLWYWCSG